jgi:glycosyltransferase 2 family protein
MTMQDPRLLIGYRARRFFRLLLAIAILALLFYFFGDHAALSSALQNLTVLGLLSALIVANADRLLMAFKWSRLLGVHTKRPGTILATQVYCSAMLLGLFLPSTIGADAARTIAFERLGFSVEHLVSSIFVERLIGLACTASLALIGLVLLPTSVISLSFHSAAMITIGSCAILLLGLTLAKIIGNSSWLQRFTRRRFYMRASQWLNLLWQSINRYKSHPVVLGEFAVLTLGEQFLMGVMFWLIATDLGVEVSFLAVFFCTMISFVLSRIPLTPGGIGVFESVFALTLATYGVAVTDTLLIALLGRFIQIATWSTWWLSFNLRRDTPAIPRGRP